ncbi:MAG: Gfo/Idh/MocA family oxidoreductase, partial [Planctomycetales bacterium]|nr:Gfo/Idh/MocA family oxidoreductase [Planctomycetales bacterium]
MQLTPEEKKVGQENFNRVIGDTRRDFLKKGIAAGVVSGAGLGSMYFGYGAEVNDPVRVGIIGTGDEGNVLIGALNPSYVQVVAIADIRPYNVHRAFHGDHSSEGTLAVRPGLMTKYGWKTEDEARKHVKVYTDKYEELLENDDIEAVIIALPLHLHDQAAIKAMRAGKHVLTEKLMGHSVHQCKEMARVSAETNRHLATGHQRHYSILYDNAVDTIKRGLIGDLHHIRAQWHRGNLPGNDSWSQPLPPPVGTDLMSAEAKKLYPLVSKYQSWKRKLDSVKGAEIDVWAARVAMLEKQIEDQIVQAEDYGYEQITLEDGKGTVRSPLEELIRWRLWNRTGGGLMAELGSHQLDAASIFISSQRDDGQKVLPLSVSAIGGRHIFPLDRDASDHVYCIYEFPNKGYYKDYESGEVADPNKKIVVTYSSINGNGFGGYGETVMGTGGTLILEREKEVMLYAGSSTSASVSVKKSDVGPTLDTTASGSDVAAAVGQAATAGDISRGYTEEIEHWAWCIRNPDP